MPLHFALCVYFAVAQIPHFVKLFFHSPSWSSFRAPKSKEEVHLKKCTNHHSNVYISPALKQFMPKMVMVMVMVARTVCLLARPLSELPVSRITETPLRLSLANSSGLGHPTKNKVGHILIKE